MALPPSPVRRAGELVKEGAQRLWALFRRLARRSSEHRLALHAAALAYSTLLSVVPLFTVVFVVTAQVDPARAEQVLTRLSELFPFSPQQVQATLATLTKRAAGLGAAGVVFSVAAALNAFWQVDSVLVAMAGGSRRRLFRLTSFLTLLLVGPLVFAGFLALPTLFSTHAHPTLHAVVRGLVRHLGGPVALILVYRLIPPRRPTWLAAALGAGFSSLFLVLISRGVTLYWRLLPQLDLIYGPLSLLLLFLVSLMLSWLVFLLGAELALVVGTEEKRQRN